MKGWFSIFTVFLVLFLAGPAVGSDEKEDDGKLQSICPRTLMKKDCTTCHTVPNWKIKESDFKEGLELPYGFDLVTRNGKTVGYFLIEGSIGSTYAEKTQKIDDWYRRHPQFEKYLIIELQSGGGGMMSMKRIKNYMDIFKANGGIIETIVGGFAGSAAFNIFLNGSVGYRYVHPQAILMWHEVVLTKWGIFAESVSDIEDQGMILRYFQKIENEWIASRSKLTVDEINAMVKRKELWVSGVDALKYGFADHLAGKQNHIRPIKSDGM